MVLLRRKPLLMGLLLALLLANRLPSALGETPPGSAPGLADLVARLDSADFHVRDSAMQQLGDAVSGDVDGSVSAELQQLALAPTHSYEVQAQLTELLGRVNRESTAVPPKMSAEEIEKLIGDLENDQFTHRETAARRLDWLLKNDGNIVPIILAIREKLSGAGLSHTARQGLEKHYSAARKAWLLAPADKCSLPPVPEEQIVAAIAAASNAADDEVSFALQRSAQREIEDLLCRDDCRERVTQLLTDELANATDPPTKARLSDLLDLTKPAMVAEIWSSTRIINWAGGFVMADTEPFTVRQATTQYLHVGVPQIPEGAPKATHFDHCDDTRAHCVSGNTLMPGDYPVGTAIPHPAGDSTIFHIVNLPTPRRRLIYELSADRSEAVRLRELSQRTCDALVAKQRTLTAPDISVLMLLDHSVVSNFAGDYFSKVDDAALGKPDGRLIIGQTTTHGGVCYALAFTGTKEAAPGLIKAIADKRVMPPDGGAYYDLPRIALLSIARRDPWDSVNQWLSKQISDGQPLVTNIDPPPDSAATAAALLADRLGESPQKLGLVAVPEGFCNQIGLPTYRFADEAAKARVQQWWRAQSAELAQPKGS